MKLLQKLQSNISNAASSKVDEAVGSLADATKQSIKTHLLPIGLALGGLGVGSAAVGGTVGYITGQNQGYRRTLNDYGIPTERQLKEQQIKESLNMSYSKYMSSFHAIYHNPNAEFRYMPPKLGKIRKGVDKGLSKIAQSGDLASPSRDVRLKTKARLDKLQLLKREY